MPDELSIEQVLTLWDQGLVTSDDVVGWADRRIGAMDRPPIEIIELSADGPAACVRRDVRDFPLRPLPLSFQEAFAIRALVLDLADDEAVLGFARWAGHRSWSGPMDTDFFMTHHELSDAIGYVATQESVPDLMRIVREDVPMLLPRCVGIARRLDPDRSVGDLVLTVKGIDSA